jgi:hypothetical protein
MFDGSQLPNGDWAEHRRLIQYRFELIDKQVEVLRGELATIRKELVDTRLKVAAFGGASGLLGWAVPQIIEYMASRGG